MIRRTILSLAILAGLACAASQADQLIMSSSYPDAYAVSSEFGSAADSIPVSQIIYVSASYSGAKKNGTLNHPYTSFDSALAHVSAATRIVFEPGTYTSAGGALPAYPLHLDGSGATLTLSAADTIRSAAYITNLNTVGDVVVNAAGYRVIAHGGILTGNVTIAAGNYSSDARRNVGNITVTGGLANIKGASIAGRVIHTGGLLTLTDDSISQTSASGTVTSTASTGAMYVNLCYLLNLGTGPAVDVSGASLPAHAIVLNNNYVYSAGTYSGVMGTATFEMTDCDTIKPFSGGSGIMGTNAGAMGPRIIRNIASGNQQALTFLDSAGQNAMAVRVIDSARLATALGQYAGGVNTSGNNWTAVGQDAGRYNTSGSNWAAVGQRAGYANTTGSYWTALGQYAGGANTSGNYWTAIGQSAGRYMLGSNWLVIDAYGNRGSIAGDTTGALICGFTNATPTSQRLYLNAVVASLGAINGVGAASGVVGQDTVVCVASGSAISLTSGTAANVLSYSIPAGDWQVSGSVAFATTSATMTTGEASISATSATHTTVGYEGFAGPILTSSTTTSSTALMPRRINISAPTTYYLVASATWSGTSAKAYGCLDLRRAR